jgi:hypothetical protein
MLLRVIRAVASRRRGADQAFLGLLSMLVPLTVHFGYMVIRVLVGYVLL